MTNYTYITPCHFGIEKTLSFEVKKIGGENITVTDGRVMFTGGAELCAKANIGLSTAERVCVVLGQFRARTFDELFEGIKALPLSDFIGRYEAFPNTGHSLNSTLKSIPACQKIVKKAMAVNLCKAYGMQTMPETGAMAQIRFSIMKDEVTLMLDTSGVGLHKRGYRRESNAAPIKETLAAGLIDLARVRENDTVIDPFCGSGTLLIEAGLKALNIAPGLNRSFAAENWPFLDKKYFMQARKEAIDSIRDIKLNILGSDIDERSIAICKKHAQKAGVMLNWAVKPLKELKVNEERGVIVCNPPYGERMLKKGEAEGIIREMSAVFAPLKGWSKSIITPDQNFEQLYGEKANKRRKLSNGGMPCTLYQYFAERANKDEQY